VKKVTRIAASDSDLFPLILALSGIIIVEVIIIEVILLGKPIS
jgi:hypothetical protein